MARYSPGGLATCSAVTIGPRLALTAGHCVRQLDGPLELAGEPARPTRVRGVSADGLDAALLELEPGAPDFKRWAVAAAERPHTWARGFAVGYGCTDMRYVTARPLRFLGWDDGFELDDWLGPVCPGDSGGGLFDVDGQLVGLLDAYGASPGIRGHGYAVPVLP